MSNVISFDVYKNTMRRTAGLAPVSSESGYSAIECNFKEGDDWTQHITTVTAGFFVSEDEVYPTQANITNMKAVFKIPGALVNNTNPIYFGITGSYGSDPEVTIATNVVKLDVVRGVVITAGDPSSDPYEDLYQQLLALVNEAVTGKMEKLESGESGKVLVSAAGGQSERSDYEITNTADDITEQTSNKLPSAAAVGALINSVQTILSGKANLSDVYTKSAVDTALAGKASTVGGGSSTEIITAKGSGDIQRSGKSFASSIGDGSTGMVPTTKAVKDALDTKANSSDVYTKSAVDTALSSKAAAEHTHSQYLTAHQDITGKEDKSNKVTSMTAQSTDAQYPSAKAVYDALGGKADTSNIPTKTSDLDNDSGFLTSHQSLANYYDKTDVNNLLNGKANASHTHSQYLTAHQDISGKEDKSNKDTRNFLDQSKIKYPSNYTVRKHLIDNYYDKTTIDDTTYTKEDIDTALAGKAASDHTHSQYLTAHQDISGKENTSNKVTSMTEQSTDAQYPSAKAVYDALSGFISIAEVYSAIDEVFSETDASVVPRLCVELYEGDYWLTYYDSEEKAAHRLFNVSSILPSVPTKTSELQNDSGFMPIVEVSSIDSCTEEKVLYRVKTGNYTASYVFNVIHPDIWGQFKIDVNSGGVLYRAKLRATTDSPWGQFDDFKAFEDTFNKVTSMTAQSTDDQYPSAKAVYDALSGKAAAEHTHSQYLTAHQDISGKADASSVYTKAEVDAMISEAGGANVVNSVSEMVDTARLYVLASTGHIWRYTSTTVEPPNELSVQSDKFNKRVSGVNISGTTSSGTGTFIADPIAVDLTVPSCTVTFKNFAAAMASYTSTTSYSQSKIIALDANQTGIANGGLMMSRRSNNDEWQITASGDDMIGDLVAFADRLVTKGAISSKSQIKYITFSPTISSSSISSADIANMGIYISTHGGTTSAWVDTGITYGGGNEEALTALDTRITAAENNIAAISGGESAVIPSYWQSEVDDTVGKIKALQDANGHELLCFGWCSDMHVHANGTPHEQYLGAVAARVMNECDIPLFLMTGDMLTADTGTTASTAPTAYKKAWEYLAPIGKEHVMVVKGNHDAWFGNDGNGNNYVYGLSPNELHRQIFAPQEKDLRRVFGNDGSYFYVDNEPQKTRFICLNSQWADYTEDANGRALYSSQKGAGFGQAQLDWLISKALNVETGYSVIIALHVPPTAGTHSSYSGAYREYAVIRGIIDAYAGKTTYSGTYTHSSSGTAYKQEGTWADVSVNCDFSSYHGTLLALFCGHTHYDQAVTNDLAVPIVCITSAVNTPYDTDAAVRVLGTSAETVIDFVCINRSTGAINLVRCGYGSDRTIS